jgi:hypothetical protein
MKRESEGSTLLADGVFGETRKATVRGFAEDQAGGAVLGVALELMRDVGRRRIGDMVAVQFDRASAVGAAKLGVVVDESFGDRLEFPEGLIAAAELETPAFDLTLVDLFGFGCHEGLLW